MKKLIIILFLLLTSLSDSDAQKIYFGDPSNYWGFLSRRENPQGHTFYWAYTARRYSATDTIHSNNRTYFLLQDYWYRYTYIYEDTLAGKIFCRLSQTDTTDYVLFDYNLSSGDTFTSPVMAPGETVYSKFVVQNIDSIRLNGYWHRRFHGQYFQPYPEAFIFLEGIGPKTPLMTLTGPFPGDRFTNDNTDPMLTCFTNQGMVPQKDTGYLFNCDDSVLHIETDATRGTMLLVYPQPATTYAHIQLPQAIKSGTLSLYNQVGQTLHSEAIQDKAKVMINAPSTPGLYYYRITDNTTGTVWQGKILFE